MWRIAALRQKSLKNRQTVITHIYSCLPAARESGEGGGGGGGIITFSDEGKRSLSVANAAFPETSGGGGGDGGAAAAAGELGGGGGGGGEQWGERGSSSLYLMQRTESEAEKADDAQIQ